MIKKLTPSEKKKLKERISKLDKQISGFVKYYKYYSIPELCEIIYCKDLEKLLKLDSKRKELRNKLKGY